MIDGSSPSMCGLSPCEEMTRGGKGPSEYFSEHGCKVQLYDYDMNA